MINPIYFKFKVSMQIQVHRKSEPCPDFEKRLQMIQSGCRDFRPSVPLRKLRWLSRIWFTSSTQAWQMSAEGACSWKRTMLPSGLRDVSTKRAASPSLLGSTPKQLTCNESQETVASVWRRRPGGAVQYIPR